MQVISDAKASYCAHTWPARSDVVSKLTHERLGTIKSGISIYKSHDASLMSHVATTKNPKTKDKEQGLIPGRWIATR